MKFTLLTNGYWEPSEPRRRELVQALHNNIQSKLFDEIHVQVEGEYPGNFAQEYGAHDAVKVWAHPSGRLTYDDWLAFGSVNSSAGWDKVKADPECVYVLANADIYFDETLRLLEPYDLRGVFLALSRWNVVDGGAARKLANSPLSQDAWIWTPPLPKMNCDWTMGEMGCDSRVARRAMEADLTVLNPCHSIKALHLHESGVRHYGPMRDAWQSTFVGVPVPFCSLDDIPPMVLPKR